MKRQKLKLLLIAGVLALVAPTVKSASCNIQQNVDLTTTAITLGAPNEIFQLFDSAAPTRISNGDSVSLTYNFLNGRLQMADLATIPATYEFAYPYLALLGSAGGGFVISNVQVKFLEAVATGGAQSEFTFASVRSGTVHLGPSLTGFLPSGSSLSFSGIQTTYTVSFIPDGTGLYKPWLVLAADQLVVTPVPEPATHVFGALVLLFMRRRSFCRLH